MVRMLGTWVSTLRAAGGVTLLGLTLCLPATGHAQSDEQRAAARALARTSEGGMQGFLARMNEKATSAVADDLRFKPTLVRSMPSGIGTPSRWLSQW